MKEELINKLNIIGTDNDKSELLDILKKIPIKIKLEDKKTQEVEKVDVWYDKFNNKKEINFYHIKSVCDIESLSKDINFLEYSKDNGKTLRLRWNDYNLKFLVR